MKRCSETTNSSRNVKTLFFLGGWGIRYSECNNSCSDIEMSGKYKILCLFNNFCGEYIYIYKIYKIYFAYGWYSPGLPLKHAWQMSVLSFCISTLNKRGLDQGEQICTLCLHMINWLISTVQQPIPGLASVSTTNHRRAFF